MDEVKWFNIGLAISGVAMGIIAARVRLSPKNGLNGGSTINQRPLMFYQFETEITNLLKTLRADTEAGFELMKEQHAEMLRRLRKHDDDLFAIRTRLDELERDKK